METEKIESLIRYISDRVNEKFTGSITLNFHKGDVSSKIERRLFEQIRPPALAEAKEN